MRNAGFKVVALMVVLLGMTSCQTKTGSSNLNANADLNDTTGGGVQALLTKEWDETPIPFFISDTVPQEFEQPILDSFAQWEKIAGKKLFDYQGKLASSVHEFDGQNVVYWDTHPNPKGYLGETYYMTVGKHQMIEADIVFFGDPKKYAPLTCEADKTRCLSDANRFDITTTALHEIGHVLGFEHTTIAGALMNPDFGLNAVIHDFDSGLVSELQGLYNPPSIASK